ncbi:MAG: lectin like domain-containing protein, partial [Ruminiclostridium sp.]
MKKALRSLIAVGAAAIAVSAVSLTAYAAPSAYSSVDRGFITSVKDQGGWGTCWSFSSTAVSEASLIKEFPEKFTSETLDLSENIQAYMASHPNLYGYKGLSADTAAYSGDTEDYLLAGASMLSPGLLFMNGYGPYAESEEYPYSANSTPSIAYKDFTEAEYYKLRDSGIAKATAMYEVKLNKNNNNDKVKQLIMDYGAATVSYYDSYEYLTYDADKEFYYYCPVSNTYDHGVAIVGWDDTIPASAFNSEPAGDGAWLIKNSYGTNSRNGGYFWLSYYDQSLSPKVYSFDFTVMGEDDYYDYSYSYDGSNSYKESYYSSSTSVYSANVFTAQDNLLISGAAFYAAEGSTIEVSVYSGVTGSTPNSGTKAASKTVSAYYGGYISCMFDEQVKVDEGTAFSIVIKATNTSETPSVYIEKAVNMHGTTRTAAVAEGQSFFSANGTSWTDSYSKGGNVMIKALAVEEICSHSFGGWTFTEEPTCTKAGRKERTCMRCKMVESVGVRALGHDYSEAIVDPTCTEQGYTRHTCSRCADSYNDTYTDATGHSYGEWTTTKNATCTEDGKKERTCSSCDAVDTETINALGHSYTENVVDPTCTEKGYTLHTCSRCDDSYKDTYTDATGHSFGDWTTTKNATCTEDGKKERT